MWGLLASTIVTSAADSFNPIGIAQQFVLQGMVKKPQHIWYFILPTGITNLIVGFMAYYGFVSYFKEYFSLFMAQHGRLLVLAELLLGIAFLIALGNIVRNIKVAAQVKQNGQLTAAASASEAGAVAYKVKSVTPLALVGLGVGATLAELTSALPYFAFLAILFNYELSLLQVTVIMVLYNIIYMSPLMVMYFIYIKAQDRFDALYAMLKAQMTKWKNIVTPVFVGGIGLLLVVHSVSLLLP